MDEFTPIPPRAEGVEDASTTQDQGKVNLPDDVATATVPSAAKPTAPKPTVTKAEAVAIADQVFIQIHQECLLPRGMQPRDLFEAIDADGSGEITLDEFREGLFQKFGMELDDAQFAAVSQVADADGSGNIEMGELIVILRRGEDAEAVADRIFHTLWQNLILKGMRVTTLFHLCDDDGSGEITLDELREGMARVVDLTLSDYEFGCVSKVADKDGSGDVSVKELVRIVARGDKKRQSFRKKYDKMMRKASDTPEYRVLTPVTPVSDHDSDHEKEHGRLVIGENGLETFEQRTPSPCAGQDMMGMHVYSPEDLNETVVRPTPWTTTERLRVHRPPAARRKEFKKAVGRPDLWHLKLRQQNYQPENILVAQNRDTNRAQPKTKRNKAIEAARHVAKLYHDGPPVHGTHETGGERNSLTLVEKAARNEIFGQSELHELAQTVRRKALVVAPKGGSSSSPSASASLGQSSPVDANGAVSPTGGHPESNTLDAGMSAISYVSGGSALPPSASDDMYDITHGSTLADSSGRWQQYRNGTTVPRVSAHLEAMSVPPYWRQRTKHPSAQHSLQYDSSREPRLCYSPRVPDKSRKTQGQHGSSDTNPNAKHRSLKPSKRTKVPSYLDLDGDGQLDEDELLIADILEGKSNARHIALEDVSALLAKRSAKRDKEKFKKKQHMSFARAVYLGEPAALRRAMEIHEQHMHGEDNVGDQFKIRARKITEKKAAKVGTKRYAQKIERLKKHALHTECKSYGRGKLTGLAGPAQEAIKTSQEDAIEELDEIAAFEQRQACHGHDWEPVTGKDWHREQRFLQNVLTRHSKDKKLAGSFTQFQKDYRRKKKDTLKRVADKGHEYIRAVNKLHFRSRLQEDASGAASQELTKSLRKRLVHLGLDREKPKVSARNRLRGGMMGARMKVKGDKMRAERLKMREARLLSLRQFSGFGRRHLEFISEQLYLNIMRSMGSGSHGGAMKIMEDAFDAIDEDLSGSVSASEFRVAMIRLNLGLSKEAIDELMHVIDNDGDGELDKVEFLRAMKYIDQKMKRMSYADEDY